MDLMFILSAVIFTLLAIVVATSLLNNRSSSANALLGSSSGLEVSRQNGHVAEARKTICATSPRRKKKAVDDWCEISGSAHDHWDVVKTVLSDEAQPCLPIEEEAAPAEHSSSTSTSLEVEPPSESGRVRTSFIGLSEKELLKFAFSHPQTEGATESPGSNDKVGSTENNSLKYVPGKARSHHLEMMMSSEELEEEKRVQREQLAAIFQLLKENKETFGDVSEGDMEEQLKLYSI